MGSEVHHQLIALQRSTQQGCQILPLASWFGRPPRSCRFVNSTKKARKLTVSCTISHDLRNGWPWGRPCPGLCALGLCPTQLRALRLRDPRHPILPMFLLPANKSREKAAKVHHLHLFFERNAQRERRTCVFRGSSLKKLLLYRTSPNTSCLSKLTIKLDLGRVLR